MYCNELIVRLLCISIGFRTNQVIIWWTLGINLIFFSLNICVVTEERCSEVESLVFDLFANLGATGACYLCYISLL